MSDFNNELEKAKLEFEKGLSTPSIPKLPSQPNEMSFKSNVDSNSNQDSNIDIPSNSSDSNKIIIGIVVLLMVGLGGYYIGTNGNKDSKTAITTNAESIKNSTNDNKQIQNINVDTYKVQHQADMENKTNYGSSFTLSKDEAAAFVKEFYRDLDNKEFRRAHNRFSLELRNTDFANFDKWVRGYDDSISSTIRINSLEVINSNTVRVYFVLYARNRGRNQEFKGFWEVLKIDGKLYLDDYNIRLM